MVRVMTKLKMKFDTYEAVQKKLHEVHETLSPVQAHQKATLAFHKAVVEHENGTKEIKDYLNEQQ